jgi:Tfp pilus assembly protein PilN
VFRINLLPKELLERRSYEQSYRWVGIIGVGVALIVLAIWVGMLLQLAGKQGELQSKQQESLSYEKEARDLEVFQESERKLKDRESVVQLALAGRVNMGQVANDLSLVLPDEVWLDELTINQDTGLTIAAVTPRNNGRSTEVAFKSVAKTLVRLAEVQSLYDVWLTTATNDVWKEFAPMSGSTDATSVPVVKFQASGKVVRPGASAGATATATPVAPASGAATGTTK